MIRAALMIVLAAGTLLAGLKHPVRFAIIGDRTGGHVEGIYGGIVAEIERLKPDFVITVGDMIEGYTEDTVQLNAEWAEYDSLVAPLSMPVYWTPGNHDITNDVMEPFYRRHAGEPFYSFDYGGVHIAVLDNSRWESKQGFPKEQIDWLIADLDRSREAAYTLVFYHKPFWYELAAHGRPDPMHDIFVKHGVDAVFAGHYHRYFSGVIDDIIYMTIGSSGGGTEPGLTGIEYHFAWVTIDDNGVHIAPVKADAVIDREEVSVADMLAVEHIELVGMRMLDPVFLTEDLTAKAVVEMEIRNPTSNVALEDTLRWDLLEGWTVEPRVLPVTVEGGTSVTEEFTVGCVGDPFPTPEAKLRFPYAEGRTHEFSTLLYASRTANSCRADAAPVVDGLVEDDCWRKPQTRFFAYGGGKATTDPVQFYFAHDDDNLYLAAVCHDAVADSIIARADEQDGAVYTEDCVGYFLQPDTDEKVVYQVYFNPLGTVFDQRIVIMEDGYWDADMTWDGVYEVATSHDDSGWSIEVRIPYEQFGIEEPARTWGLNFRRKQPRLKTAADWQVPISYDPDTYGLLRFE